MAELNTAARKLVDALAAVDEALRDYYEAALAVGRESGNPTERGFDARQVRNKLKAHVIATLSPRNHPVLEFDGAPQARRYAASNPLPGLA